MAGPGRRELRAVGVEPLGRRLYRIFFKTYTEKVWGIPCTEIRAEWAAQRIQGLSLARALLSGTALNHRPATIKSLISQFKYPRLGPGQMWEACRDRVIERGGRVLLNHPVTRLDIVDGRVRAVTATTREGEQRFEADHVISTVPLRSLIQAAGAGAPNPVRVAAKGLNYRNMVVVALILDRDKLFPDNWLYIHTPHFKVGRVQNFNNWSGALVPESGRTCLGMEYFCSSGDEIWQSDDASLIALATKELDGLGLGQSAAVLDAVVVRAPDAYPVYDSTYADHLAVMRGFLDPISNLHTVGRNGMHKYNNQDHSMYAAMLTVANLHGESHDVWSVNTDLEYHELQRMPRQCGPRVGGKQWSTRSCAPVAARSSKGPDTASSHNQWGVRGGCWSIASPHESTPGKAPGTAPQSRLKRARRAASRGGGNRLERGLAGAGLP